MPFVSSILASVYPRMNHNNSSTMPLKNVFLVVSNGNESFRSNLSYSPNSDLVPTFVLSRLIYPWALTRFTRSIYCYSWLGWILSDLGVYPSPYTRKSSSRSLSRLGREMNESLKWSGISGVYVISCDYVYSDRSQVTRVMYTLLHCLGYGFRNC
jgi:hypothetical protein